MKRQLIVGSAGSSATFDLVKGMRERYGAAAFLVAIDTNPRECVAASRLSDTFVKVPLARSPEFVEALAGLAAAYPGSCYLPMHDEEIEVAARLVSEGNLPPGLRLIAPSYDVVRRCNDKWSMHHWLRTNGFQTAKTVLATPETIETVELPAVLKPRVGTGSQGVRLIRERSQLAGLAPEAWLLQECLQHPEVGVVAFLGRATGAFHSACHQFWAPEPGLRRPCTVPGGCSVIPRSRRRLNNWPADCHCSARFSFSYWRMPARAG